MEEIISCKSCKNSFSNSKSFIVSWCQFPRPRTGKRNLRKEVLSVALCNVMYCLKIPVSLTKIWRLLYQINCKIIIGGRWRGRKTNFMLKFILYLSRKLAVFFVGGVYVVAEIAKRGSFPITRRNINFSMAFHRAAIAHRKKNTNKHWSSCTSRRDRTQKRKCNTSENIPRLTLRFRLLRIKYTDTRRSAT